MEVEGLKRGTVTTVAVVRLEIVNRTVVVVVVVEMFVKKPGW